jgi:hypothetical protein
VTTQTEFPEHHRRAKRAPELPVPDVSGALGALDNEIRLQEGTIQNIEEALKEHKLNLRVLVKAREALVPQRPKKRRDRQARPGVERTAAQRAGSGNVDAARRVLRRSRRLPKAEFGRRMAKLRSVEAINDGTVTYAIQALVDAGEAREVGRENGSRTYEYVAQSGRAVTRPGDR